MKESLRSLMSNASVKPQNLFLLDDCSDPKVQVGLAEFALNSRNAQTAIHLYLNGRNMGVGNQFQSAFNIVKQVDPDLVIVSESDYYYRAEWLSDVLSVFEFAPYTIAIPGMDHQDMRLPEKYNDIFSKLMIEQFGEDIKGRPFMYKPFDLITDRGNIKVFGVSNSCGCQILHWNRIKRFIFNGLGAEQEYWKHMERGFHVGLDRSRASDGHMSCVLSFLWEKWALKNNIDISKNFGYLNIADASIAFHACNGGLNGQLDPEKFPEGGAFEGVNPGTFPEDYNNWSRNKPCSSSIGQ